MVRRLSRPQDLVFSISRMSGGIMCLVLMHVKRVILGVRRCCSSIVAPLLYTMTDGTRAVQRFSHLSNEAPIVMPQGPHV